MKKLLIIFFLGAMFLVPAVFSAQAAYDFSKDSGINDIAPTIGYTAGEDMPIEYYIGMILSVAFSLMGLIFLILTIYAGINWMTAQGNTSQIDKAKNTIVKAIVGLVICLSAYAITYFVMNVFEGTPQVKTTVK